MNKEELILSLIDKLLNNNISNNESIVEKKEDNNLLWSSLIWKYVILRGYDSWVHFGKLEFASTWLYRLSDSRRLWGWTAKESIWLSWVAIYWVKESWYTKICPTIPLIEITDNRISEIIPCSDEAINIIKNFTIYNP